MQNRYWRSRVAQTIQEAAETQESKNVEFLITRHGRTVADVKRAWPVPDCRD